MLFDGKIFVLRKVFHMISHYLGRNGMLLRFFFFFQRDSVNEVLVEQEKSLHASSVKAFFFFWGVGAGEEETSNNNNKQQNMHTKKQTTNLPSHAGKKGRKQDLPTVIRITGWTFLPLSFQKR